MRNKIVLGLILFFNIALAPMAFASGVSNSNTTPTEVLYSGTLTANEINKLELSIPPTLKPSFQSMTIQAWDGNGVEKDKTILFCKDLKSVIHWDNKCPDLTPTMSQAKLEKITKRADLPKYNPASEPKKTTQTIIVAIAAVTLLGGGGLRALGSSGAGVTKSHGNHSNRKSITQTKGGTVFSVTKTEGKGDLLWKKNSRATEKSDKAILRFSNRLSAPSPFFAVMFSDGVSLRAMLGGFAYIFYPLAILVGILSSKSAHYQSLPPSLNFVLLFALFGTLDALAGALVAVSFMLPVILVGNADSFSAVLTLIGISQVAICPILLATAIRPMRREVNDFSTFWERITDFVLASILGGWVVEKIVEGLSGLSGVQLAIVHHGRYIGLVVAGLIFVRYLLEEFISLMYPKRLSERLPELSKRNNNHKLLSILIKTLVFSVIAWSYLGSNIFFWLGVVMYITPMLLGLIKNKFPKKTFIHKWRPKGVVGIVLLSSFGTCLGIIVHRHIPDAKQYMLEAFVLLSIPGFLLSILGLFGKEPDTSWNESKIGRIVYPIFSVIFFVLLLFTIQGVNFFGFLIK